MADWSKPSVTDTYANFLSYLVARTNDAGTLFTQAAPTNPIQGMVRWNPTTNQFEQYQSASSTWTQLWTNGLVVPSVTLGGAPTSANQAATKAYVDALNTAIATAQNAANTALPLVGGTLTGNLTISGGTPAFVMSATGASQARAMYYESKGVLRWAMGADGSTESGSNAGSNYFISRYNDAGAWLDTPQSISRTTGQTAFSVRPLFGGATPWDSVNLPAPMSAGGGNITGDLTLWQNTNATGDVSRLAFTNAVTGLTSHLRLNGSTAALEVVNSAYNAVNAQFLDNGNMWLRGSIAGVTDVHINGTAWFAPYWHLDSNGASRVLFALGDMTYIQGGGGVNNWSVAMRRNDGVNMAIASGNGDFYIATLGWLTAAINAKAPGGVWHHNATAANCGGDSALSVGATGNTLQLTLTNTNCNCNCANCTCFPAGTPIMMADGTYRVVEQIRVGDMLMTPTGPEAVLEVETPLLGSRKMLGFEGSIRWTDDHAFWTRRGGREGLAVADLCNWLHGVELGIVKGLPDNDAVLVLDSHLDEFAHVDDGWRSRAVLDVTEDYAPDTKVYLPIVGGCHLIVADGYVMSGGINGFDFDYTTFNWEEHRARITR